MFLKRLLSKMTKSVKDNSILKSNSLNNEKAHNQYEVPQIETDCLELQSLIERLPATNLIKIVSYADENDIYGKRYSIDFYNERCSSTPFIQYKLIDANESVSVFANSYHPFVSKITKNIIEFSKNMQNFITFKPYYFEISKDMLVVGFNSGYYNTMYIKKQKTLTKP